LLDLLDVWNIAGGEQSESGEGGEKSHA
jgi:hypothetical protein